MDNESSGLFQGFGKNSLFIFFKDFIYLFMRDTVRQRHRQREKQALSGEPKPGFSLRTPGDHDLSQRHIINH